MIVLQKTGLQPPGTEGREWKLKTSQRMGSLKTASSGMKKTVLVLTFSHSTRGGQKGLCLPFIIISRRGVVVPHMLSSTLSAHGVVQALPPHTSVPKSGSRNLGGTKGICRQTSNRKESRGWSQPATLTQSRGGIPGWTYTEVREDELPCERCFYNSLQSLPSGRAGTLRHHQ